jgi:Ni,Fe-hydrogenase III small subunit
MTSLFRYIASRGVAPEPLEAEDTDQIELFKRRIDEAARRLFGRSLHIRQVDAGSCNGCELEIGALNNPYYDLERFGLHFVASPRHADCLLVTGPVTRNMADPLKRTYEATPAPKLVVAVGDCAHDCGVFAGAYGVVGPVASIVPVDSIVHGCPPAPTQILRGIMAALEKP